MNHQRDSNEVVKVTGSIPGGLYVAIVLSIGENYMLIRLKQGISQSENTLSNGRETLFLLSERKLTGPTVGNLFKLIMGISWGYSSVVTSHLGVCWA